MTKNCRGTIVWVTLFVLCLGFGAAFGQARSNPGASPEWSLGNRKSRVVIEVFSDYQCKRCTAYNDDVKHFQSKYGDRVRIIIRQFPLTKVHPNALAAAQVAEAAGTQGKFFEMNDMLYSKASEWRELKDPAPQFLSYARALKLNLKRFETDLAGQKVQDRIRLDNERAVSLNLPGTPTVVINGGRSLHEDLDELDSLIDAKLKALKP